MRCANPKCKKSVRPRVPNKQGGNPSYCSEACANRHRQKRWYDRVKLTVLKNQ
jgi:hypothetical protein